MVLRPILPKIKPEVSSIVTHSIATKGYGAAALAHVPVKPAHLSGRAPSPVRPLSASVSAALSPAPMALWPVALVAPALPPAPAPRPDLHVYFGPESQGGLQPALFKEIRVEAGDTLYGLAQRHQVPAAALAAASAMTDVHNLRVGQRLRVPTQAALELAPMAEVSALYSQALSAYDHSYGRQRKAQAQAQAQRQQEVRQQQSEAREWARQAGLTAGQISLDGLSAFSPHASHASADSAKHNSARSKAQARASAGKLSDLSGHLPQIDPEVGARQNIVWSDPHYVALTSSSRSADRFKASIHQHLASNSGALEALSAGYQRRQARVAQDTSFLGKVARFLEGSAAAPLMNHPIVATLVEVARRPEWEQYFRSKRLTHEAQGDALGQQIERKGGVNEWSQVNVGARGLGDLVNYGEGLVLGALPTLVEATVGGLALRGLTTASWATRGLTTQALPVVTSAKAAQVAGTVGVLEATTLSSLGSLLDAQRDQSGGLVHLQSALALTPLFVAANALGITGRIGQGTLLTSTIKALDQLPGVTGTLTRTLANMGKLSATEGVAELYQEGAVAQLARMKIDGQETFINERANHRRYEAFAGGAFMGGMFGVGGGRRKNASQGAQQPSFVNSLTLASQNNLQPQLRLGVNHDTTHNHDTTPAPSPISPSLNSKLGWGNHPDLKVSGWHHQEPEFGAEGLSRAAANRSGVFQPLQLARPELDHSWRIQLQIEAQDGGYRVAPDLQGTSTVLSVDRDGNLETHLPHPTYAKAEATQRELLLSAAHMLNEHAVQVNTVRQRLWLGSADLSAALFVERTRHYQHQQNLPLREAAAAAAADVLQQAPLTSDFGLTEVRNVRISGDQVLIEAQRKAAQVAPAPTQPPMHSSLDADLNVLAALVGPPAQKPTQRLMPTPEPLQLIRGEYNPYAGELSQQPTRSAHMPEQTSLEWLLAQEPALLPGKEGVWVTDWTDEQLLRLAEKLNAQVALTLLDGRPRLTSGTANYVYVVPPQDLKFEAGAPLRVVHLQPRPATQVEQHMAHQFLVRTQRHLPYARMTPAAVIYRDAEGQMALQPYGPQASKDRATHYNAQALGLEGAPDLNLAIRMIWRDSTLNKGVARAVVRISGLSGMPNIEQIRSVAHGLALERGAREVRFEWDLENTSDALRMKLALALTSSPHVSVGLAIEPRYHFDFSLYRGGQLLTWSEPIHVLGGAAIKHSPGPTNSKPQRQIPLDPHAVAEVEKSLYGAISNTGLKSFEILLDLLSQPRLSPAQLAERHRFRGDIENTLRELTFMLTKKAAEYAEISAHIHQFLEPALPTGLSAQAYLGNFIADPIQWLKSRDFIQFTPRSRLSQLSLAQLEGLQALAASDYDLTALMNSWQVPQKAQRAFKEHLLGVVQKLRYAINPRASSWHVLNFSYRGGLEQLAQDVQSEINLRARGEVRSINYPALWLDSQIDGNERLSLKEGNQWRLDIGGPNSVSAEVDAAQVRAITHTHPEGDVKPEVREPQWADESALNDINEVRQQTRLDLPSEQRDRLSSVRYGPANHHVAYFGLPEQRMPRNARLMNALGDARRTITQAIAQVPLQLLPAFPGLHLKQLSPDVAVIRLPNIDHINLPYAFDAIRQWADQQPALRTLRIESADHDLATLQKNLRHEATRAHINREEHYDFSTGHFDLNLDMAVASITLGQHRAEADAHAHELQGVARAYALHTLYFAGNKTYDRPQHPDAINLEKFVATSPLHEPAQGSQDSQRPRLGAEPTSRIKVTFHSPQRSDAASNSSAPTPKQAKQALVKELMRLSPSKLEKIDAYLEDSRAPASPFIQQFTDRLRQIDALQFADLSLAQLITAIDPRISFPPGFVRRLLSSPVSWARRHFDGAALNWTALRNFNARDLALLRGIVKQTPRDVLAQKLNLTEAHIVSERERLLEELQALSRHDLIRRSAGKKRLLTRLDQAAAALDTSVQVQPELAAQVRRSLYKALTSGKIKRFEMLLDLLEQPGISSSELSRRHGVNQAQPYLISLAHTLLGTAKAPLYASVVPLVTEFLRPLLQNAQTPHAYLKAILDNPGRWARAEGMISHTSRARLIELSQHELEFLKQLGSADFSPSHLQESLPLYKFKAYLLNSAQAVALRSRLNPQAHSWEALGLSYPGGLHQFSKDIEQELLERDAGQFRAVNFAALWHDSAKDRHELLSVKSRTGWERKEGKHGSVSTVIDPAQLQSVVHTHVEGAHHVAARSAHAEDLRAMQDINAQRAALGLPALMGSFRFGPQPAHVSYFGLPDYALPRNARLMNELEHARRTITQAIAQARFTSIHSDMPKRVTLKMVGDTAVVRFGENLSHKALPQAVTLLRLWLSRHPEIETVRIESTDLSPQALSRHFPEVKDQGHLTTEDQYNFMNGEYDLTRRMAVVTLPLLYSRAQADAEAHTLGGVDRAYALHTLYAAGHKTYVQPDRPGSVNLEKFVPTDTAPTLKDTLPQRPDALARATDSKLWVTFRSPDGSSVAPQLLKPKDLQALSYAQLLALNVYFANPKQQAQVLSHFDMSESEFSAEIAATLNAFGADSVEALVNDYSKPSEFKYHVNNEIALRRRTGQLEPLAPVFALDPIHLEFAVPKAPLPKAPLPKTSLPEVPPLELVQPIAAQPSATTQTKRVAPASPRTYPSASERQPVALANAGLSRNEAQALYDFLSTPSHQNNAVNRAIRKLGLAGGADLQNYAGGPAALLQQLHPLLPAAAPTKQESADRAATLISKMTDEQLTMVQLAALGFTVESIKLETGKSDATLYRTLQPLVHAIHPNKQLKDLDQLLNQLFDAMPAPSLAHALRKNYLQWAQTYVPGFRVIDASLLKSLSDAEIFGLHESVRLTDVTTEVKAPDANTVQRKNSALRRLNIASLDELYRNTEGGADALRNLLQKEVDLRQHTIDQAQNRSDRIVNALRNNPRQLARLIDQLSMRAYPVISMRSQGHTHAQIAQQLGLSERSVRDIQTRISATLNLPSSEWPRLFQDLYASNASVTALMQQLSNDYGSWARKHLEGFSPIKASVLKSLTRRQAAALYVSLFGDASPDISATLSGLKSSTQGIYAREALRILGVQSTDTDELIKHFPGGARRLKTALAVHAELSLPPSSNREITPKAATPSTRPALPPLRYDASALKQLDRPALYVLSDLTAHLSVPQMALLHRISPTDMAQKIKGLMARWGLTTWPELLGQYEGNLASDVQSALTALPLPTTKPTDSTDLAIQVWRYMNLAPSQAAIARELQTHPATVNNWIQAINAKGIFNIVEARNRFWNATDAEKLFQLLMRGPEVHGYSRWTLEKIGEQIQQQIKPGKHFSDNHVWQLLHQAHLLELAGIQRKNARDPGGFTPLKLEELRQAIVAGPAANGFQAQRWDMNLMRALFSRLHPTQRSFAPQAVDRLLYRLGLRDQIRSITGPRVERLNDAQLAQLRTALEQGPGVINRRRPWSLGAVQQLIETLFDGKVLGRDLARDTINQMYPGGIKEVSERFKPATEKNRISGDRVSGGSSWTQPLLQFPRNEPN